MKTKSKNDSPRGLHLRFFGVNAIVEAAQPEQARLDAMTKGYLMCREVHSLFLDHLDAWNDWRTEHAKGLQADSRLVLSLYGRFQRITEELRAKGHDPIDWGTVGADMIIVRKSRLDRGGAVIWDPLTPVTPFVQPSPAGRVLKTKLENSAEGHFNRRRDRNDRGGYHSHRAPAQPREHIETGPVRPVLSSEDVEKLVAQATQAAAAPEPEVIPVTLAPIETPAAEVVLEVLPEQVIEAQAEPLPIERITEVNAAYAGEFENGVPAAGEAGTEANGGDPATDALAEGTAEPAASTIPYGLSELAPGVEPEGVVTTMEPLVAEPVALTPEEVASQNEAAAQCCTDLQDILDQLPKQTMRCSCGNQIEVGK